MTDTFDGPYKARVNCLLTWASKIFRSRLQNKLISDDESECTIVPL
jgi:hypothetical protein